MSEWEPTIGQRMFVSALAKMVAPMQSAEAVNAMLALLPALKHLPEEVFARPGDLAAEIGGDMERVPTLAKLRKALDAWWEANRPKQTSLMSATLMDSNLSNAERTHVSIWQNHSGAGDLKGGEFKMRLDVLRYHQPKAYHWLIEHDLFAAEIAVKAGWRDPLQREPPRTDDDVAAVASVVRGAVYGVSVPKDHAPGVSKPLPDEPHPVRKSVAPTPEQIDALRENNPLLKSLVMRQDAAREAQETPGEPSPSSDVKGGLSESEQKPTGGFGGESGLRWDDPPADLDEPNVVPLFPWRT